METKDYSEKGNFIIYHNELDNMGIQSIYEAKNKINKNKCLCKLINLKGYKDKKKLLQELDTTISIHSQIENENISNIVDYIKGNKNIYIFFDYIKGKTLYYYQKEGKNFNEKVIMKIIKEILEAIQYLYENSIILNDLKLENILLTDDGRILLGNLEKKNLLSNAKDKTQLEYSFKIISLRLGLVICKLIDFQNFLGFLRQNNIKSPKENDLNLINEYVSNNILEHENISNNLRNLIIQLLRDENNRINIEDIKSHAWFQNFSYDKNNDNFNKTPTNKIKEESKTKKETKIISKSTIGSTVRSSVRSSVKSTLRSSLEIPNKNADKNNITEIPNQNDKSKKPKEIREETIITDEAYLAYYTKEREVLLGLIDSFDENEIFNNMKLAEKYAQEKAKNDKHKINQDKRFIIMNDNVSNSVNDENEKNEDNKIKTQKPKKKGFLGMFSCH